MRIAGLHQHIYTVQLLAPKGFPPIREIGVNFEAFFQSGKSGENGGFSARIREEIFKSGNFFFKTIFKPFNLKKNVSLRL